MVDPGTGAWYHSTTVGRPVKPSKLRIHVLGFMDSKDLELGARVPRPVASTVNLIAVWAN